MQPLVAFVSFYRGDVKVFETAPLAVTERTGCENESDPAAFQPAARRSSARPLRLPGDGSAA